jgi:hypothetical protein
MEASCAAVSLPRIVHAPSRTASASRPYSSGLPLMLLSHLRPRHRVQHACRRFKQICSYILRHPAPGVRWQLHHLVTARDPQPNDARDQHDEGDQLQDIA